MLNRKVLALFAFASMGAFAQSYSFYYTMQAGRFAGADWEMGVGDDPAASDSTRSYNYNGSPGNNHWGGPLVDHQFQMGWFAPTNTAFVRLLNAQGVATTAMFTSPTPPIPANTLWTIPASSFFTVASPLSGSTSITLSNFSVSPGVSVLSGALPVTLASSQSGGTGDLDNAPSPIVIDAASAGGSWYLAGTIRFTGLQSQGGSASGQDLRVVMTAIANATNSNVPEAGTLSMIGLGLVAVAAIGKRRNRKCAQDAGQRGELRA